MYTKFLLLGFLTLLSFKVGQACKGCLTLDQYNIHKILPRFKAVLVKFDVAYPYGEKHEVFEKIAEDIVGSKDLILGQIGNTVTKIKTIKPQKTTKKVLWPSDEGDIGIKDYGEKENEELGKKFGITSKEQLPQLKLFVNNNEEPLDFPKDTDWTADNIRTFIRSNTDMYIGLSGCLEDFDKLAGQFMKATNKDSKIAEAEKMTEKLEQDVKSTAAMYIKFMQKVIENGTSFVGQEIKRLNKVLKGGRMHSKKKRELTNRVNILHSFTLPKDEL